MFRGEEKYNRVRGKRGRWGGGKEEVNSRRNESEILHAFTFARAGSDCIPASALAPPALGRLCPSSHWLSVTAADLLGPIGRRLLGSSLRILRGCFACYCLMYHQVNGALPSSSPPHPETPGTDSDPIILL